jgi:hypothetical protein
MLQIVRKLCFKVNNFFFYKNKKKNVIYGANSSVDHDVKYDTDTVEDRAPHI